ncbi:MAG: hypothetical protein Q8P20_11155, partial [bacterium]|nr:hypothetical protein [bacterium]
MSDIHKEWSKYIQEEDSEPDEQGSEEYEVPPWIKSLQSGFSGPNGSVVLAYEWRSSWDQQHHSGDIIKVSDWDNKVRCAICGRSLTHIYWVLSKDKEIIPVGEEDIHEAIGLSKN